MKQLIYTQNGRQLAGEWENFLICYKKDIENGRQPTVGTAGGVFFCGRGFEKGQEEEETYSAHMSSLSMRKQYRRVFI